MDIGKILLQLREERDRIAQVIAALELLVREGKRGRGRPPGSSKKKELRTASDGPAPMAKVRNASQS